jgi:DNA-binding transcriptional ArsR family regulator
MSEPKGRGAAWTVKGEGGGGWGATEGRAARESSASEGGMPRRARPRRRAEDTVTDETLRALAEPRRRAILRLVASDELPAGEIAAAFDVTRTAISQHLTVLKNAGLLAERREGTRRLYRARPEGLAGLRQFLDEMWASSLDTARRLVESERGIIDDDQAASAG